MQTHKKILWQTIIPITFLLSALAIVRIDRLMSPGTLDHMKRK